MSTVTVHCVVKNEENFVWYAIKSVVDFVDLIMVFDTGSTDRTVEIIKGLVKEYPHKIIFEEKGESDKTRHTQLRQEMVNRTITDWFMVLDGDEIWTKRAVQEAIALINQDTTVQCIVAPYYLCVGDIFHYYHKESEKNIAGTPGFGCLRFIKIINGVHWKGQYNEDSIFYSDGKMVVQPQNTIVLKNKFWHLTHLVRSSKDDADYSSGGNRSRKRRLTYFILGRKIKENIPEVFLEKGKFKELSLLKAIINFFKLVINKKNIKINQ